MSRVMLINGQHAEELRVAVVDDGVLESFQLEVAESGQERGNIYRGVVANIEPSLDAAFVDYGNEKHGFLTSHDVVRQAYHRAVPDDGRRPGIGDVLEKGKSVLVQVARDAVGTKGSALTTNISLPGRYVVLTPFDSSCGLSRKIEDETARKQLKEKAASLTIPDGHGFIIRTSAADQTKTALKGDLAASLRLWKRVLGEFKQGKGPRLLYDDQDLIVQALRDYLDLAIEEVLIDDEKLLERATEYVKATMPRSKVELSRYSGRVPLFSRYNLEPQIDSIYRRVVPLPGGGSIVIDHTEALTAIDVNSGKNTRGSTQEETAYRTNLEAASEVARQLRLRNIGGLVVVDFIDMRARRHRAAVEKTVREAMKRDKSRVGVGRISSNGLLEINRQRMKKALVQRMHRTCPTCDGVGLLATPELVGLRLLRRIEARAATGRLRKVRIGLHPELADALQNQRRRQLVALENEYGIQIEIGAQPHLHRSEEEADWIVREPSSEPAGPRPDAREGSSVRGRRESKPLGGQANREPGSAAAQEQPSSDAVTSMVGDQPAKEGNGQRSRRRRRRPRRRRHRGPLGEGVSVEVAGQGLAETPTEVQRLAAPGATQPAAVRAGETPTERTDRGASPPGRARAQTVDKDVGAPVSGLQSTPTQVEQVLGQAQEGTPAEEAVAAARDAPGEPSSSGTTEPVSSGRRRSRRRGGARRKASKAPLEKAPLEDVTSAHQAPVPAEVSSSAETSGASGAERSSGLADKLARQRPSRRRSASQQASGGTSGTGPPASNDRPDSEATSQDAGAKGPSPRGRRRGTRSKSKSKAAAPPSEEL